MGVQWDLKPEACELPYLDLGVSERLELESKVDKLSRPSNGAPSMTGLTREVTLQVRGDQQRLKIKYDYKRRLRVVHRIIVRCLEEIT